MKIVNVSVTYNKEDSSISVHFDDNDLMKLNSDYRQVTMDEDTYKI